MNQNLEQFENEKYAFRSKYSFSVVDRAMLDQIRDCARKAPHKRARICCHQTTEDSPQEMLVCLEPGTYIRPHRHFDRTESGLALLGKADAVFFDDEGNVTDVWPMGALGSGLRFYYRIQEPVFHCLLVRDEPFVFHEVSTGPFDNEKTDYALWAPEQNKLAEIEEYLEELRFNLAIFVR